MINMPIELYTDGSSLHNPGPSGLGYVIRYWDTPEGSDMPSVSTIEGSQGFRLSTNNRMEIMAFLYGMRAIISKITDGTFAGAKQINVFADSQYLVNAINMKWIQSWTRNNWMTSGFQGKQAKPVKNKDLWEQVIEIQNTLQSMAIIMNITHVDGHAGHEFNERADQLATGASNGTDHIIDEVYEKTADYANRKPSYNNYQNNGYNGGNNYNNYRR